jgi:hypothetical protein
MSNTTTDGTMSKLLAKLRTLAPAKVRAYAGDDDHRDIAVPTRRKRWSQVIEAIEARSWTRVELLDKGGNVLGYVDNAEPAGVVEDIGGPATAKRAEAEWIVNLVVRAQRDAMTFRDAEVKSLLQAQGDVVREMSQAMHGLATIYREQRDAAANVAELRATAAATPDGFNMKELMEALPVLMQALPMLRGLLAGGVPSSAPKSPKPPNGASHG